MTTNPAQRPASNLTMILTTVDGDDAARSLAADLLEAGLAACVQCEAIRSLYVWDGAVQDDAEVRLVIKTPTLRREAAIARLREIHPYDVPQLLAFDASHVDGPYLDWALDVTG